MDKWIGSAIMEVVQPTIEFFPPDGAEQITAKWRGDARSFERKIGMFDVPGGNGTETQDLGYKGTIYPITFFFDGDSHQKLAEEMWNASAISGVWVVYHPTKGQLELRLMKLTENIQPTSSSNITTFTSEWIEALEGAETTEIGATAVAAKLSYAVNGVSNDLFDAYTSLDTSIAGTETAIKQSSNSGVLSIDKRVRKLVEGNKSAYDNYIQAFNGFSQTVRITPLQAFAMGGQILSIIETPILTVRDVGATITAYRDAASDLIGQIDETIDSYGYASLSSSEFMISNTVIAAAGAAIAGSYDTISAAVNAAEKLTDMLNDTTEALDSAQDNYSDLTIDKRYYSQTETYSAIRYIVSQAISYLLSQATSLKTERRFTLAYPRTAIDLTVEYYGGLGENDELLDYFISTNNLVDTEYAVIPAGREVVVYA